ncbi:MAG: hypothetical protein OQJ89_09645 [Kangiellaceae bacterium]|nr:hypothetical protein [Kangiellaceae bacterium]MCW9017217.1 hypothetical protein [Kangiellaceae bacterium]
MEVSSNLESILKSVVAFAMICILPTSLADDSNEKLIVSMVKGDNTYSLVRIKTDESEEELKIPQLEVGSSVELKSKTGKTIVVSKDSQGIKVNLEEKTILLPKFKGKYGVKLSRTSPLHSKIEKDIIVSGAEFSPEQMQIIKQAFANAGVNKPVKFSNHQVFFMNGNRGSQSKIISSDKKSHSEINVFISEQHISIQPSKKEEEVEEDN